MQMFIYFFCKYGDMVDIVWEKINFLTRMQNDYDSLTMIINSIKTHPITSKDTDISQILDQYLTDFHERDILVITSKILWITEWSIIPVWSIEKDALIHRESDEYLDVPNPYGVILTIKNGHLVASAWIDESNGDNHYILWPKDLETSVKKIWDSLRQRFGIKECWVIITDSVTRPLLWGVTGISIASYWFEALRDYRNTPDIFGRHLHFTQSNIADGLAAAAVLVMGEGNECTPLAHISELSDITFTQENTQNHKISRQEDIYGALLENTNWKKGG